MHDHQTLPGLPARRCRPAVRAALPDMRLLRRARDSAHETTNREDDMTDKELLELAAKAAGRLLPHGNPALTRPNEELHHDGGNYWFWPAGDSWNPLTDDGAALRLAVRLRLMMDVTPEATGVQAINVAFCSELHDPDPFAATRRAIVRAAAELGKAMQ